MSKQDRLAAPGERPAYETARDQEFMRSLRLMANKLTWTEQEAAHARMLLASAARRIEMLQPRAPKEGEKVDQPKSKLGHNIPASLAIMVATEAVEALGAEDKSLTDSVASLRTAHAHLVDFCTREEAK